MSTERIELVFRTCVDPRLRRLIQFWLPLFLFLAGASVLAALVFGGPDELMPDKPWLGRLGWIVAPVGMLLALGMALGVRAIEQTRLTIDRAGMAWHTDAAPIWGRWLWRSWSVGWEEIIDYRWWNPAEGNDPISTHLILRREHGKRIRVVPAAWVSGEGNDELPPVARFFMRFGTSRRVLADTPIVQAIRHHRPDLGLLDEELSDDQLRSTIGQRGVTPTTGVIAALAVSFLVYFIADVYVLAEEFYAGARPWAAYAGFGVLAAAVAALALKRAEPERKDSWGYALLLGVMAAIAAYPGLLRVNAWLSGPESVRIIDYRLDSEHLWQPVSTRSAPVLDLYMERSEWWRRFEPGDTYRFRLRDGALGFWQVDLGPGYEAQRRFYESAADTEWRRAPHDRRVASGRHAAQACGAMAIFHSGAHGRQ